MTIAVAVSGGTDSFFTLELLRERGESVLAVHGFFLPPTDAARAAVRELDARCAAVGVPFHAVDLSREFEREVIAPFAHAYAHGHTPNPCALCNPAMKFGLLFDAARGLGATRIATGHYATLTGTGDAVRLSRGADPAKDQSYFLSLVPRGRLARAVLPLGGWTKDGVRAALDERGLTPPLSSESQEICFVPGDDYCAFLQARGTALPGPGPITLADGTEVGRHDGLWRYTLGQRRGIGVAWSEPLYVVAKDMDTNRLVVGPRSALDAPGCTATTVNVLVPPEDWPDTVLAKTRYRQRPARVRAALAHDALRIHFLEPQTMPAPGQIAALYDAHGTVLAGGIITEDAP